VLFSGYFKSYNYLRLFPLIAIPITRTVWGRPLYDAATRNVLAVDGRDGRSLPQRRQLALGSVGPIADVWTLFSDNQ